MSKDHSDNTIHAPKAGILAVTALALATNFAPAAQAQEGFTIIPIPTPRAAKCYSGDMEAISSRLSERYGEVVQEAGSRYDGILYLFADVAGDDIGEDDMSWTLIGQPYIDVNNPDAGVYEDTVCVLGSDNEESYESFVGSQNYKTWFTDTNVPLPEDASKPQRLEIAPGVFVPVQGIDA